MFTEFFNTQLEYIRAVRENFTGLSKNNKEEEVKIIEPYIKYKTSDGKSIETTDAALSKCPHATDGEYWYYMLPADGSISKIGNSAFDTKTTLTAIEIPSAITAIGNRAFAECTNLTQLVISEGVKDVDNNAFYKCTKLTSLVIPSSLTFIKGQVFYMCTGLKSIMLPDTLSKIGSMAFANCSSLATITMPVGVTNVYDKAFYNDPKLKEIIFKNANAEAVGQMTFGDQAFPSGATLKVPAGTLEAYQAKLTGYTVEEIKA